MAGPINKVVAWSVKSDPFSSWLLMGSGSDMFVSLEQTQVYPAEHPNSYKAFSYTSRVGEFISEQTLKKIMLTKSGMNISARLLK